MGWRGSGAGSGCGPGPVPGAGPGSSGGRFGVGWVSDGLPGSVTGSGVSVSVSDMGEAYPIGTRGVTKSSTGRSAAAPGSIRGR
jgi:hypothetical protein